MGDEGKKEVGKGEKGRLRKYGGMRGEREVGK